MLQEKNTEVNKMREKNNEAQLKIKELEHNISKHHKESQDTADKVRSVSDVHPPIAASLCSSNHEVFGGLFPSR